MATTIFPDTAQSTRILSSTETNAEVMVRQGGLYLVGVVGLPAAAVVTIESYMGGTWVKVDEVKASDLEADGAVLSGVSTARLSVGRWRFSVNAADPTVYIGAAGEG